LPAFVPGQRWISETEPELGLGIVLSLEGNRVTILFVAVGDRRIYAAANAPLTRVRFSIGDVIDTQDGIKVTVQKVVEQDQLLTYIGIDETGELFHVEEMDLDHAMQFNKPQDRLFTGQLDSGELFSLRHETLRHQARLEQSPVRGLVGSRTSLIPHQIYIAHEVASREYPRVLLADEVGLGKTIEAGMILHHQLLTGKSERVLIVVPDPLLHQWLVEMRRRFNLKVSLFDEERYLETGEPNPFSGEQLVLCSLDFLMGHPDRQQAAVDADWDLIIVDEAHHLGWNQHSASAEYTFIERLSSTMKGLLLLTATPEQLGKEGHFARLRLLDPVRFHSYDAFLQEELDYVGLAGLIHDLLDDDSLGADRIEDLRDVLAKDLAEDVLDRLAEGANQAIRRKARDEIIQVLLDRHGTGRVLFRNTRATIQGFPERLLEPAPLSAPSGVSGNGATLEAKLHPERLLDTDASRWWELDPRIPWLVQLLKNLRNRKVLVICALSRTAIELEDVLRVSGIQAAVFHEALTIIARDRAAAWFADEEEGAQVLVCSEIGSEGRNFQFAHHLVLFDLPLNADLLEQRIGRLDRIGQTETIKIHVPYFEGTAQEILFDWYHRGLNAFETLNPAAQSVHEALRGRLIPILSDVPNKQAAEKLQDEARTLSLQILSELQSGRDRLLELNSCRDDVAQQLVETIQDEESNQELWPYLERIFDAYGISIEEHSAHCFILRPGEHMRMQFPELPDEGTTVTLNRSTALSREDIQFLTFEHPMVSGAMDIILNTEHGNAALAVMQHPDIDPGQLLVECYHVIDCSAPKRLHVGRFYPPTLIRTLSDAEGNDLSHLKPEEFHTAHRQFDREHAVELLRAQRKLIEKCIKTTEKKVSKQVPTIAAAGTKRMLDMMTVELKRLAALRKVNPNVRQEEIDQMKASALELHTSIQASRQRLDSIRVIVTT
jgi:ATP-dependent helicase HepA